MEGLPASCVAAVALLLEAGDLCSLLETSRGLRRALEGQAGEPVWRRVLLQVLDAEFARKVARNVAREGGRGWRHAFQRLMGLKRDFLQPVPFFERYDRSDSCNWTKVDLGVDAIDATMRDMLMRWRMPLWRPQVYCAAKQLVLLELRQFYQARDYEFALLGRAPSSPRLVVSLCERYPEFNVTYADRCFLKLRLEKLTVSPRVQFTLVPSFTSAPDCILARLAADLGLAELDVTHLFLLICIVVASVAEAHPPQWSRARAVEHIVPLLRRLQGVPAGFIRGLLDAI